MTTPAQRKHLDRVTRLLPGYDPWATAGDCMFDYDAAQFACDFFPGCLTHTKGEWAGRPLTLEDWQQGAIGNLFGWRRKDGTRRYRQVLIYIPRKNGKTQLIAGIGLLLTFLDGEGGSEVYCAAANKEQAGLAFSAARGMVHNCAALSRRGKVFTSSITYDETMSTFLVLTGKASTKHGLNPHGVLIDELHTQKDRELVDTLTTAVGARRQPLVCYLTTADYSRPSICNEVHKYASDVRDGVIDDSAFLPIIYEATRDDDWTSEETWRKANPNYGVSVKPDYLRAACQRAKDSPAYENTFKRLHLNIITEQANRWMQLDRWDQCKGDLDHLALATAMEGQPCFAGLDLAATTDLAALALCFPPTADRLEWVIVMRFWIPSARVAERERKDRGVPYRLWAQTGALTLTEGDVIDYDIIRRDITELGKVYQIKEIAIDRWSATQITNQLQGDGFEMVPFGQGFASMSDPTKQLEKLTLEKRLTHAGHPVLRWNAANVAVVQDAAGNIKPAKDKSTGRIDGIVACIMAIGRASAQAIKRPSVYQDRGIIEL